MAGREAYSWSGITCRVVFKGEKPLVQALGVNRTQVRPGVVERADGTRVIALDISFGVSTKREIVREFRWLFLCGVSLPAAAVGTERHRRETSAVGHRGCTFLNAACACRRRLRAAIPA
jgi:hypothetical protein